MWKYTHKMITSSRISFDDYIVPLKVNPLYEHTTTIEPPIAKATGNLDMHSNRPKADHRALQDSVKHDVVESASDDQYAHLNSLASPPNLDLTYSALIRTEYAKLGLNSGSRSADEAIYNHLSHQSAQYEDVDI